MKKSFIILLVLFLCGTAGIASAVDITIDEIIYQPNSFDPSVLSGTAGFELSGSDLIITLTNTSGATGVAGAYNLLSGIGFNLPSGMSISGGSVGINPGSDAINFIAPLPQSEWGYDNSPITGPFIDYPALGQVNTVVATLQAAIDYDFNNLKVPPPSPGANVDGPGYGLLSSNENNSAAGGLSAIKDTILITLNLSGSDGDLLKFIEDGNVVISFGSPTATSVPEPSTLLLLGSGLIGLGILGRKRFHRV